MTLRNKDYGDPQECEYGDCDRSRGAPLNSVYHHGCVLCVFHEDEYQKGRVSLPESATQHRKQQAKDEILG